MYILFFFFVNVMDFLIKNRIVYLISVLYIIILKLYKYFMWVMGERGVGF